MYGNVERMLDARNLSPTGTVIHLQGRTNQLSVLYKEGRSMKKFRSLFWAAVAVAGMSWSLHAHANYPYANYAVAYGLYSDIIGDIAEYCDGMYLPESYEWGTCVDQMRYSWAQQVQQYAFQLELLGYPVEQVHTYFLIWDWLYYFGPPVG